MRDAQPVRWLRWAVATVLLLGLNGLISTLGGQRVGQCAACPPTQGDHAVSVAPGELLIVSSGRLDMPHRTWGQEGAAAFHARAEQLRTCAASGVRAMVRPNHMDVLSDIQRCLAFARAERGGLQLAMDPVGLLAPSMVRGAGDHLPRIGKALAGCPAVGAIVATNLVDSSDGVAPGPVHRGLISAASMDSLMKVLAPLGCPILVPAAEIEDQLAALRSWGIVPE